MKETTSEASEEGGDGKEGFREVAGAIRAHLWKPTMPTFAGEARPWSMEREHSIYRKLVKGGWKPGDIAGAITVVRTLRPDWTGPLSLRAFYWRRQGGFCATPFLEECIGYWHKRQGAEAKDRATLAPSVRDIMRRMVG